VTNRVVVRWSTAVARMSAGLIVPCLVVSVFLAPYAFQDPLGFILLAAGLYGVASVRRIRSEGFVASDTHFFFPSLRFMRRLKVPKESVALCVVARQPSRIWLELRDGKPVWFKFGTLNPSVGRPDPRVSEVGQTMRRELAGTKALVLVDPRREDIPSVPTSRQDAHVVKEWIKPDRIEAVWLIIYASLWFLFYAIGASASGVAS